MYNKPKQPDILKDESSPDEVDYFWMSMNVNGTIKALIENNTSKWDSTSWAVLDILFDIKSSVKVNFWLQDLRNCIYGNLDILWTGLFPQVVIDIEKNKAFAEIEVKDKIQYIWNSIKWSWKLIKTTRGEFKNIDISSIDTRYVIPVVTIKKNTRLQKILWMNYVYFDPIKKFLLVYEENAMIDRSIDSYIVSYFINVFNKYSPNKTTQDIRSLLPMLDHASNEDEKNTIKETIQQKLLTNPEKVNPDNTAQIIIDYYIALKQYIANSVERSIYMYLQPITEYHTGAWRGNSHAHQP